MAFVAWCRRQTWTRHLLLPGVVTVFLIVGFRLVPGYRGQMNPDGVSYLTIARQYLDGHWADALNAYWSPLYSWLLAPLIGLGIGATTATKVLAILVGGGIIGAVWWLLANLRVPIDARLIVSVTLFPILYYFGMDVTTPDLLITACLLLYAAQMTSPRYGRRWWDGALSGVLGGIAYLAKAYALPVVGTHLVLVGVVNVITRRNRPRRRALVQTAAALLVFASIVGAWSTLLTRKYGFFTTGTTGRFNIAWNAPNFVTPMHGGRLLPLPNETGTSAWDDATVLPYERWNPLATWQDRRHWEQNRDRNQRELLTILQKFTWLLWPILLIGIRLAGSRWDPRPRRPGAIFVTLLLIYPIGYWLLHVYERFLSLLCVGLLVLGVFVACRLTWPLHRWARLPLRVLLTAAVAWSLLSKPNFKADRDPAAAALGRWSIADRWGDAEHWLRDADRLAGLLPARSRIASNNQWSSTLYLGFLLDLRYYGEFVPKASEAIMQADLAKYGVDYFWVWGKPRYKFLAGKPEISGGRLDGLRIYDLRPMATSRPTTQP